jgi:hypothetical protein
MKHGAATATESATSTSKFIDCSLRGRRLDEAAARVVVSVANTIKEAPI